MPLVKPRELKSINSINLEPDRLSSKMHVIISMDIAGYTGNQISEAIGMTPGRVSIIRNSPLFTQERDRKREELHAQVISKKSDKIVAGDPVEIEIKNLAMRAVQTYDTLLSGSKSDMVKKATADAILDRAGYKAHADKTIVSVEVTEKMADRFERVLGRSLDEPRKDVGATKISITKTMS
jgi:hypothetical protein